VPRRGAVLIADEKGGSPQVLCIHLSSRARVCTAWSCVRVQCRLQRASPGRGRQAALRRSGRTGGVRERRAGGPRPAQATQSWLVLMFDTSSQQSIRSPLVSWLHRTICNRLRPDVTSVLLTWHGGPAARGTRFWNLQAGRNFQVQTCRLGQSVTRYRIAHIVPVLVSTGERCCWRALRRARSALAPPAAAAPGRAPQAAPATRA
jgi:hypothetical protein